MKRPPHVPANHRDEDEVSRRSFLAGAAAAAAGGVMLETSLASSRRTRRFRVPAMT